MILAHCGGALPALAWRVTHLAEAATSRQAQPVKEADVREALSKLYFDTALSATDPVLTAAMAVSGADHLLFGTDSGAASEAVIESNIAGLVASSLSPEQRVGVNRGNAADVFTRRLQH